MSEHFETMPNLDLHELQKFKVKDPDSNNVFERKVIYELKRENDILRKELTSMGFSSVSMNNRMETQNQLSIYQQQFATEQDRPEEDHNAEVLVYYKNKNKQLDERIDELLKVNKDLKEKIAVLSAHSHNHSSIDFYKEQISRLEAEIGQLQAKIKQILAEHQNLKDEVGEY